MVGGFASQLHGARHQTYDIDFVPAATEANDDRLAAALRELGARLRVDGLTDEEARQLPVTIDAATLQAFGSTTWTTDAGPLDVLRELPVTGDRRRNFDELRQRFTNVAVSTASSSTSHHSTTSSTERLTPTAPRTTTPSRTPPPPRNNTRHLKTDSGRTARVAGDDPVDDDRPQCGRSHRAARSAGSRDGLIPAAPRPSGR